MVDFVLLTWAGSLVVEEPFIVSGQFAALYYFFYFLILVPLLGELENNILFEWGKCL